MAGWGTAPFDYGNHWWVIPVIGTHVGGIVGAILYVLFVESGHDDGDDDAKRDKATDVEMAEKEDAEEKEKMMEEEEEEKKE